MASLQEAMASLQEAVASLQEATARLQEATACLQVGCGSPWGDTKGVFCVFNLASTGGG